MLNDTCHLVPMEPAMSRPPFTAELQQRMVHAVVAAFPEAQAVYLYGSFGTPEEWPDSDVDIALLLPPLRARQAGSLVLHPLASELAELTGREVDLINARRVSTVLQKEIVMAQRRIHCADEYAADEFEMLTISYYVKLNEERAGIIAQALADGRFLQL